MKKRHWTLLVLAALAFDLAVIVLFHRTGHSRRTQWMSIGTGVILFVGVPTVVLTLLFGSSLRTKPDRRWGSLCLTFVVLAIGAVALAYRYRYEHIYGEEILLGASVLALFAGGNLAGSLINRKTSILLAILGSVSIAATTIAVVIAWSWNPCRYQFCVEVGIDGWFGAWMSLASALVIAGVWIAYYGRRARRARWGLRFAGLVLTMYLGAFGTFATASHVEFGPFYCGPPILPYDAPLRPPSSTSFC
jgi:hypothetical protein